MAPQFPINQKEWGKTTQIRKTQKHKNGKKNEPLLASSVPNLSLDDPVINPNTPGGEFNADSGFRFDTELIAGESG